MEIVDEHFQTSGSRCLKILLSLASAILSMIKDFSLRRDQWLLRLRYAETIALNLTIINSRKLSPIKKLATAPKGSIIQRYQSYGIFWWLCDAMSLSKLLQVIDTQMRVSCFFEILGKNGWPCQRLNTPLYILALYQVPLVTQLKQPSHFVVESSTWTSTLIFWTS